MFTSSHSSTPSAFGSSNSNTINIPPTQAILAQTTNGQLSQGNLGSGIIQPHSQSIPGITQVDISTSNQIRSGKRRRTLTQFQQQAVIQPQQPIIPRPQPTNPSQLQQQQIQISQQPQVATARPFVGQTIPGTAYTSTVQQANYQQIQTVQMGTNPMVINVIQPHQQQNQLFTQALAMRQAQFAQNNHNQSMTNNISSVGQNTQAFQHQIPINIQQLQQIQARAPYIQQMFPERQETFDEVVAKNNGILMNMRVEFQQAHTFSDACSRLADWLKDERAYVEPQLDNIYECLKLVIRCMLYHSVPDGSMVFEVAAEHVHLFKNERHKQNINEWIALSRSYYDHLNQLQIAQRNNITPPMLPVSATTQYPFPNMQRVHVQATRPTQYPLVRKSSVNSSSQDAALKSNDPIFQRIDSSAPSITWKLHQINKDVIINLTDHDLNRMWRPGTSPVPSIYTQEKNLPLSIRLTCQKTNRLDDDKCEWPEGLKIFLDDQPISFDKKVKQLVQGRTDQFVYNGVDRPLDLSDKLRSNKHRLTVRVPQSSCICVYSFSIDRMLRETKEIVLNNARKQIISLGDGISAVNQLLCGNTGSTDDDDIIITQHVVKVSMKCPLALTRINEPVKGIDCRHVSCFDLISYVEVNRLRQTWTCPDVGCRNKVTPDKLRTDMFFKKLLQEVPNEVNMIEVRPNGEWRSITECNSDDDDISNRNMRKRKANKVELANVEVIVLDSDDESDASAKGDTTSFTAPVAATNIVIPLDSDFQNTSNTSNTTLSRAPTSNVALASTQLPSPSPNSVTTNNSGVATASLHPSARGVTEDSRCRLIGRNNVESGARESNVNTSVFDDIDMTVDDDEGSITEEEMEEVMDSGTVLRK